MNETTPLMGTSHPNHNNKDEERSSRPTKVWLLAGIVVSLVLLLSAAFYGGILWTVQEQQQQQQQPRNQSSHTAATEESKPKETVPPPHRYVATQFISFTISTVGGIADEGECSDPDEVDPNSGYCYLGNPQNITEDVFHRLQILKEVVLDRIQYDKFQSSKPDVDHSDSVLKIVMIPEFYWRGPYGAYSLENVLLGQHEGNNMPLNQAGGPLWKQNFTTPWAQPNATHKPPIWKPRQTTNSTSSSTLFQELTHQLQTMLHNERDFFRHYLFVFGTVVAASTPNDPRPPWEIRTMRTRDEHKIDYFNLAFVYHNGASYVVTKRYMSGIDFLSRTSLPNPKTASHQLHTYQTLPKAVVKLFQRQNLTVITDNVLELNDDKSLRIGLEICLDHRMGTLWNHLQSNQLPLVDVLLITSAGMAIERGPNPLVPGGVVYLSDGDASSAACMRTDHHETDFHPELVCRGQVGGRKHIPIGGPGYSSFFPLAACWDVEANHLLKGYYSQYQPQGCAYTLKTYDIDVMDDFAYYPPSIEIYPTVQLPVSSH